MMEPAEVIQDVIEHLARRERPHAMARLKEAGFDDLEAARICARISTDIEKRRSRAELKARVSRVLSIFGIQVALLIGAGLSAVLFAWLNDLGGCWLGFSVFGICVVKSIVLTIVATAGLSAVATCLMTFAAYFE